MAPPRLPQGGTPSPLPPRLFSCPSPFPLVGPPSRERGKGYASEALGAVARWALAEGVVQRAWLTANTDNLASVRVAEKAGFRREGTLRRAGLEDDGLHDLAVFSLLDDEL